jgi:hypothetical protein
MNKSYNWGGINEAGDGIELLETMKYFGKFICWFP